MPLVIGTFFQGGTTDWVEGRGSGLCLATFELTLSFSCDLEVWGR